MYSFVGMIRFSVRCTQWESFTQRMQLLVENSSSLRDSKSVRHEAFLQFKSNPKETKQQHFQASLVQEFHPVLQSRPLVNYAGLCLGTSRSALWLPLDLLLEDAMDGSQVNATSAVEIITGNKGFVRGLKFCYFRRMKTST